MNKYEQFKALHHSEEILLLPNAWDVPSTLSFKEAGFTAIGTTSWAVAEVLGYRDGEKIPFDEMFTVVGRILRSCDAMITVDMESGYSNDIDQAVENIARVADAGAVGINLEDSIKGGKTGAETQLHSIARQADLIRSIKSSVTTNDGPLFINARTDTFILNSNPQQALRETIERGKAYAEAGADCLFVPFLTDSDLISELLESCDLPLNILATPETADLAKLQELGVSRLSLGNGVFDLVVRQFNQLAMQLKDTGAVSLLFGEKV